MSQQTASDWLARTHWQRWLVWILFIVAVYELRDFFFVAFITFLLCYLVRSVVGAISRRIAPGPPRVWLDRMLTLLTFVVMAGLLIGLGRWMGPRFVRQSRTLLAQQENLDPRAALQGMLDRTVGAALMRRKYGGPQDERYQAALQSYEENHRHGEGWYSEFPVLYAHLRSGFEAQHEQKELERIDQQVRAGMDINDQFDQWFLRVKAPELFAQKRDAYLAQWAAEQSKGVSAAEEMAKLDEADDFEQKRDGAIRQRILRDVKADPVVMADLRQQWEKTVIAQHWLDFQRSPQYQATFRDYYQRRHEANPEGIPFPYDTYTALRDAYPRGKEAFARVLQSRTSLEPAESDLQLRRDFELATRQQLTHDWWTEDSFAAGLREHASEGVPRLAAAVGERLEKLVRRLLALPAELATALLLTLFICFDMLHLRESLKRLRESRVGHLYNEIVPGLVVFSRLIGRSFSAQALIAVFNSLFTLLLLKVLGIENELLLCMIVFIGSFIPVLGVLLSSIPIAIQALLQPDGSVQLALQAVAGIVVIHFVETSFLSPKIVGKVLHLHPVMVLVILAIGEHFFGIWGLLLGVPVAVYLIRVVVLKEPIPGIYEPSPD